MPVSQPFRVVCQGGLDLTTSPYELLGRPNVATRLTNFEVSNDGGYRRIKGYSKYGAGSATRPDGANKILGVYPYALGVVVCVSTNIYYSEDGITWIQINKDTGHAGSTEAVLATDTVLPRTAQGRAQFVLMKAPTGHTSSTYGSLSIATGPNAMGHFHIEGTGGSRTFTFEEVSTPTNATYIEYHDHHLCVVDATNAPSTVYYSANDDDRDFAGTGAGSITLADKVVGLKSFRDDLYIFCANSIHKLVNINTSSDTAVVQVTNNLGCVSGYTIQEIGGDLIFLASDGLRTIAGTERIDDIELGTLSRPISPLLETIINNSASYDFSSTVLKNKDQYRLFYINENNEASTQKGIIGTIRSGQNGNNFEWSETLGIEAYSISSGFNTEGEDVNYHGDLDGYIYIHNSGNDFDGTAISYEYETPDMDFGDPGVRKTLHYMLLSVQPQGSTDIKLNTKYEFKNQGLIQPGQQAVGTIASPSYYGTATYGSSIYGGSIYPIKRINLRGSGTSASFSFTGSDSNPPFAITGFYITFVPMDRR